MTLCEIRYYDDAGAVAKTALAFGKPAALEMGAFYEMIKAGLAKVEIWRGGVRSRVVRKGNHVRF